MNIKALENKFSYWILLVIGFQAFPILPLGGSSFKIYELLGLIILFIGFRIDKKNAFLKACACFFLLCPFVSLLWGWTYMGYPYHYFARFATDSASHGFKFNYYIFPILALIFMFANYAVFRTIIRNERLYRNIRSTLISFSIIGTIISIFSLLAMLGLDIKHFIPMLSSVHDIYDGKRSLGFSMEPSMYIIYQTWVIMFVMAVKPYVKRTLWYFMMTINIVSIVCSFSTAIVAFIGMMLVSPFFIFKTTKKIKIIAIVAACCLIVLTISAIVYMGLTDIAIYAFQDKLTNFLQPADYTTDSGSFRNFTGRVGIKIWEMSPMFGVGIPMSTYYMHLFENKMGIATWGETINATTFPLNTFSQTLAELGIVGFISLCTMLFIVVRKLWKYRYKDRVVPYLLIGTICNIAYFFSNATLYTYYLWIFIVFSAGYCYYIEKEIKIRRIRTKIMNKQKKENHENSNRLQIVGE